MKTRPLSPPTAQHQATERVYKVWRERFIAPLLLGILIFGAIALFPAIQASSSIFINAIFILAYLLIGLAAVFKFSYNTRITAFLFSAYVLALGELISLGILGDSLFFFLALIIFATMLHSPRAGIYSMVASVATFMVMGWLMQSGRVSTLNALATPTQLEDWVSAGGALVMFGAVIVFGFQQLENEFSAAQGKVTATLTELEGERNNLENRVQERTLQLRRINKVERAVSAILDINDILPEAAKSIQFEFDFYYTAIYLMDPSDQWAELKEAVGEMGNVMKEKKHRISISGRNAVADVIQSKSGRIVDDPAQLRSENPMFPYTRSLIVVPLVIGDTVLGVVEMHSSKDHEFLPQDLDAYQTMANGISISIENSRLYQEAQQSIAEMQATQRQYLETAWSSLASEKTLTYAIGDAEPLDSNILEVPLTLRDQTIGQIFAAGSAEWTPEQRNLIDSIAAQATLALENARLVENSQVTASQERLTNEIIAKIWASQSMDSILQTTVRELGRNLEAAEVEIEVSMEGVNTDE